MITQEMLDEAILDITGRPEWNVIQAALNNEIYQCQAASLDVPTWEEVCALKGYAKALAFVVNLRDMTNLARREEAKNAQL